MKKIFYFIFPVIMIIAVISGMELLSFYDSEKYIGNIVLVWLTFIQSLFMMWYSIFQITKK